MKVEALSFKVNLSLLLHDFFLQNYNSFNIWCTNINMSNCRLKYSKEEDEKKSLNLLLNMLNLFFSMFWVLNKNSYFKKINFKFWASTFKLFERQYLKWYYIDINVMIFEVEKEKLQTLCRL